MVNPAFSKARGIAFIGDAPRIFGLNPTGTKEISFPRGLNPLLIASSLTIITTPAAPSLIWEEFPAVVVPSSIHIYLIHKNVCAPKNNNLMT